ncbi:hypothetical protein P6144_10785 [Sphingomonas sp. HITSZ_GF]|uniref:hypothetical protein n=1 Tax=Sphingomonas sp. HITSZ_GF TaxID=3037247 RepID=UPI00240D1088|nr:hypothetical protein [Sphingomonas sp. HITSZ_GF]MDG2534135.1 hypothetical protein [Sphingomonas sp. HITSZ_GF]
MTPQDIKTALQACFAGNVFTAPDTLFGSGTLKAVFDKSLPGSTLVITGTLSDDGSTVTGTGQGVFAGMNVTAVFTPSGDSDVLLVATGTGDSSWTFGTGFPALSGSLLADLSVAAGAQLILRTISDNQHPAGLNFMGSVGIGGPLEQAAKFVGTSASLDFAGPITFTFGAPVFTLTAPVTSKFSLGPLTDLGISIELLSTAAPAAAPGNTDYGATGAIAAATSVGITVNGSPATLPAALIFNGGALVDLQAGAPNGSGVTIADLMQYALGGDLNGLMPPKAVYDLADAIQLNAVDFYIAPLTPALAGVGFSLSATSNWTMGSKFALTGVAASLYVDSSGAASGYIEGALQIGTNGSVCTLDAIATLPDGTFAASLDPNGAKPNLTDLVTYLAGDFGLPAITVSDLSLAVQPTAGTFDLGAGFSTDWQLGIGDFGLAVTAASIQVGNSSGSMTGSVSGTLVLDQNNQFDLSYAVPGGFRMFAQVPSISLSALIAALCNDVGVPPPDFEFTLTDSTILITQDGQAFDFAFGTQIGSLGSASLVVQKGAAGWGFAFGILLEMQQVAGVPGLSALKYIDDAFALDEIVLVFGTIADSTFAFPALSGFDNPAIKGGSIASPGWTGGLVAGFNLYAMMTPSKSAALGWLCKLIDFEGSIAASLQVPENPDNGTTFAATISGNVNSNMAMSGALFASLVGDTLTLGLKGVIPTTIAGDKVTFTIVVAFQPNGVFISGSTSDTINFADVVQLGGLAIELGVDDEGIPSIGVAGTIQVQDFNSSIAIFFDSAQPEDSMFAGAVSDITLDQVMGPIVGVALSALPPGFGDILKQIALRGTDSFTLPATLGASLDARDATAVAAAFNTAGYPLSNVAGAVSILGSASWGSWAVTDIATQTHYTISKGGANGTLGAEKNAQVKFVPQTTQIGALPPIQAGYAMSGELDVFGLKGVLDIDIQPSSGLSINANLSPIVFLNANLLSITAQGDTSKGALLSVSTWTQNGVAPHANATAQATLLGLSQGVTINISASGANFTLSSSEVVYTYTINVTLTSAGFTAAGNASVGIDKTVDLGILGSLPIDIMVGGNVAVAFTGSGASASFGGSFSFEGTSFSTGQVTLDVTQASLSNLASEIESDVVDAIVNWLKENLDPSRWVNWIKNNVIPNIEQDAAKVGQVLAGVYQQTADEIAGIAHDTLNYGADAAAAALKAANFTSDIAMQALDGAKYAAQDVADAIASVFDTHVDTHLPHIDTPSGPHVDVGSSHVDQNPIAHGDTAIPPHIDGAGPHLDTPSVHMDVGFHADTDMGLFHIDKSTGHGDTNVPPHGDTVPHVDTPSGPHVDTPLTPHVDITTPHADTIIPPHGDTTPHLDVQA